MLAKYWKKIALLITVVAILFNITFKLVKKTSFEKEVNSTVDYVKVIDNKDNEKSSNQNKENTTPKSSPKVTPERN